MVLKWPRQFCFCEKYKKEKLFNIEKIICVKNKRVKIREK
ncbi:hypothetical protein CLO_3009 [Clostridium botulinum E1 str. 'BoNT E Beluga']|nr:hypothetical protein CLO_3009 [Clostridium botulinum E1 str. 'BoNT E Beluga']